MAEPRLACPALDPPTGAAEPQRRAVTLHLAGARSGAGISTADVGAAAAQGQRGSQTGACHYARLSAMRPVEKGQFREVKTGVLLLPQERVEPSPGRRSVVRRFLVTCLGDADETFRRLYGQLRELGWVGPHTVVVILGDGAEWIWNRAGMFVRRCEILDFWHALEHAWTFARLRYGEGSSALSRVRALHPPSPGPGGSLQHGPGPLIPKTVKHPHHRGVLWMGVAIVYDRKRAGARCAPQSLVRSASLSRADSDHYGDELRHDTYEKSHKRPSFPLRLRSPGPYPGLSLEALVPQMGTHPISDSRKAH